MATTHWRAWMGPRFTPSTNIRSFNWTGISAGATFAPAADKTVTTTVVSGATSVVLNSVAGLAPKGGGFLGPNGAGQGWEYIEYESIVSLTLANVAREDPSVREHNGTHTSAAIYRQWWPLTSDDGRIHVVRRLNDEMSALTWEMDLSGVLVPRFALKNEHIVVIERRVDFGSWVVFAVGWLAQPEMKDDASGVGEWKATVRSIAGVLGGTMLRGLRVGTLDVAKVADAQTNTKLAMAWKERHSGDFVEADPNFEPENVLDSDPGTLWIGERVLGTDIVEVNDSTLGYLEDGDFATQLHLHRPPNGEAGYRWIEWMGGSLSGDDRFYSGWICNKSGQKFFVDFGESVGTHTTFPDRHVICEDRERFLEANPMAIGTESIFEVPTWWWDTLDLANDCIGIHYIRAVEGNKWSHTIAWGTDGLTASKRPWYNHDSETRQGDVWPGVQIPPPVLPIRMIRFVYNAAASDPLNQPRQHYVQGYIDHVGYRIEMGILQDWERPWVMLTLPGIGLTSRDHLTASVPGAGAQLYIVDGGGPAVGGLPNSGVICIGDERISYSAKNVAAGSITVTARGVSGSTALGHRAGDIIEVVDTDGVATDGMPIEYLGWTRQGGTSYPSAFKVWTSNRQIARPPADDNQSKWLEDWNLIGDITGYAGGAAWGTGALTPVRRVRHVLIEIYAMTGNPSRPRLNEFRAELATSLYPSNEWIALPSEAGDVLERLLLNAGVPAAAIDTSAVDGLTLSRPMGTAYESAWKVIEDAASYLGLRIEVALDSKIRLQINNFWWASSHITTFTWTRSNAAQLEVFWEREKVWSQVAVAWEARGDAALEGVAHYPSSPYWLGEPVEVGPYMYASQADADNAAERRFWMARFPYRFLIQAAQGDGASFPGDVEAVSWQMAGEPVPMTRQCLCISVDSVLEQGVWTTIHGLRQITRDPYDA